MQSKEMTEADQQVLRDGLHILARLIARHHLAQQEADLESCAPPASADRDINTVEFEGTGS